MAGRRVPELPDLDTTFEAVMFDWDGTAVPDRAADAAAVRERVEALCSRGVHVLVVSGTHVGNVDGQLGARPPGPGTLHLCLNRGSEVFEVTSEGPSLVWKRAASDLERQALDRAASGIVEELHVLGLEVQVVSSRLNRRKIDLIPDPAWMDPPKARIAELLEAVMSRLGAAGIERLGDVVSLAERVARSVGLDAPRVTSDAKHVEVGLTDKSDSGRWAAAWLRDRGITGSLVLVVGDELGPMGGLPGSDSLLLVPELARVAAVSVGVEPEGVPPGVLHVGGGPERFLDILAQQLGRRADRRVPWVDEDASWVLELPADPRMERVAEALGTLSNGSVGTRAAREEDGTGSSPLLVMSGIYSDGADPQLIRGPGWSGLTIVEEARPGRRLLDLRTGVLARESADGRLRTLWLVSATRPEALALRAEGPESALARADAPVAPAAAESDIFVRRDVGRVSVGSATAPAGGGLTLAIIDREQVQEGRRTIERLAACVGDARRAPPAATAAERVERLVEAGFDRLLAEHRCEWARRWADAEVEIEGDPESEQAARFALFHLMGAVASEGEAAVGARGLSGGAYGGHVFWDADVFTLPALAAVRPMAARAMLEYRVRRLPAAREEAVARGLGGARFPWESAADGRDVTPREAIGPRGVAVRITTGDEEEHIVADVAWAVAEYVRWSGDTEFRDGPGRDLMVETARYWASRVERDDEGRGHLRGVTGPDEYHTGVDDNAYTNVMARWNLRAAAELVSGDGDAAEAEATVWREIADGLADGYDDESGTYEQFCGYDDLEPLLMEHVARVPVAVDVLLGARRVRGSQLIKQADVLMLHHLVPGEVAAGSLAKDLARYEPRTAHGSSLSPAIHAALLARAGRPERALELFRLAARLDLDDVTGTTAGGLHLAALGGVWQALAYGFLGLRPHRGGVLDVDPALPQAWRSLSLRLCFQGARLRLRATHRELEVSCDRVVRVRSGLGTVQTCEPPGRTFPLGEE